MDTYVLYLVHAGVCFSVGYCVYLLFLQKETFFTLNRFFLLFLVLFSTLFPFINIQSPFQINYLTLTPYTESTIQNIEHHTLTIFDILMIVYCCGVFVMSCRFIYQFSRLLTITKKHGINKYKGITFVITDNEIPPFSFLKIVFIPKSLFFNEDFEQIVTHELIHIKQFHSIDLLVMELFSIAQWFNPFVWSYKKALKEIHEYLADRAVIARGCEVTKYQVLLFKQFVGIKSFALVNSMNSQIKRRIVMITKNKSKKMAKLKILFILPVIGLLLLAFAEPKVVLLEEKKEELAQTQQAPQQESTSDTKSQEEQKKQKVKSEQEVDVAKDLVKSELQENLKKLKQELIEAREKLTKEMQIVQKEQQAKQWQFQNELDKLRAKQIELKNTLLEEHKSENSEKIRELEDELKKVTAKELAIKNEIKRAS